jgi:thioredoxin 1
MLRSILILILFSWLYNTSCTQNPATTQVSSTEFNQLISTAEGILLDVRTHREFQNGHIEHAGQLNFYALDFRTRLLLLPKDKPVYLYCNTGYRSDKAADFLIKNGYTQVYNLQRGIMEWELADLPVIIDSNAQPDMDDKFSTNDFAALVQTDSLVFIDFYAPWCGPCRQMMPMIDSLMVAYHERIQIVKVNADASKQLMRNLELMSVPHLALYQQGRKVFEHNGLIDKDALVAKLESHYNSWKNGNN